MADTYYNRNIETLPHLPGEVVGGCELPEMPFDFLQPTTRKQLTQIGYGGPFVIRSNPIGAILDAIKGFCNPVPMSFDGSTYTDLTDSGLGSYGDATSPYLGAEGTPYSGPFGSSGNIPAFNAPQCGSGTMWDVTSQMCVPSMPASGVAPMAATNMCDDPAYASSLAQMAAQAFAARDVHMLCQIQANVVACQRSSSIPGLKNVTWPAISAAIVGNLKILGCNDCGTCKGNQPMAAPTPTPTGGGNPNTSNTGGTGPMNTPMNSGAQNPPSPGASTGNPTNMPSNPFDYIGHANNPMYVTNPPASQPVTVSKAARPLSLRLPEMPNPMSLTEGNIRMHPSAEPMLGMFDPAAAHPSRSSPRPNYGTYQTRQQLAMMRRRGQI